MKGTSLVFDQSYLVDKELFFRKLKKCDLVINQHTKEQDSVEQDTIKSIRKIEKYLQKNL
ncbi:hypothetical protein [Candidatus Uabimicrobium sp. HlEnr_7]|uniref:hypothetical protein n=1 Tax=Candidatus Uabimicrobium helgolandensis TaxID=3095367 RepID=UPI0035574BCE